MKRAFAAAALLACATAASAQSVYSCRDHTGRLISSDRPIAECADRPMRETTPTGILKREIAAPLSADQIQQREQDERNRRLADQAVREKQRRDQALLAAYSSEADIEQARRRALVDVEESIRSSQTRLATLDRERTQLAVDNRQYVGKLPPIVQRRVDDNAAAVADEQAAMKVRQADRDRINQRYDDERERYRQLMTGMKSSQR